MTFKEAQKATEQGKAVSRRAWDNGKCQPTFADDSKTVYVGDYTFKQTGLIVTKEDQSADDWYVVR